MRRIEQIKVTPKLLAYYSRVGAFLKLHPEIKIASPLVIVCEEKLKNMDSVMKILRNLQQKNVKKRYSLRNYVYTYFEKFPNSLPSGARHQMVCPSPR